MSSPKLLSRLSKDRRRAYVARKLAGLAVEEVAALLRCSPPEAERLAGEAEATLRALSRDENSTMSDPISRAALELAAECPVRICGQFHANGDYSHYRLADGRVRCFGRAVSPPEGSEPSQAQKRLWQELSRGESEE